MSLLISSFHEANRSRLEILTLVNVFHALPDYDSHFNIPQDKTGVVTASQESKLDLAAVTVVLKLVNTQQVFSMLLRKCRSVGLLIPNLPKHVVDQETYEGATVIEPKKAFYEEPIATLDFASLYPSIMQVRTLSLRRALALAPLQC